MAKCKWNVNGRIWRTIYLDSTIGSYSRGWKNWWIWETLAQNTNTGSVFFISTNYFHLWDQKSIFDSRSHLSIQVLQ